MKTRLMISAVLGVVLHVLEGCSSQSKMKSAEALKSPGAPGGEEGAQPGDGKSDDGATALVKDSCLFRGDGEFNMESLNSSVPPALVPDVQVIGRAPQAIVIVSFPLYVAAGIAEPVGLALVRASGRVLAYRGLDGQVGPGQSLRPVVWQGIQLEPNEALSFVLLTTDGHFLVAKDVKGDGKGTFRERPVVGLSAENQDKATESHSAEQMVARWFAAPPIGIAAVPDVVGSTQSFDFSHRSADLRAVWAGGVFFRASVSTRYREDDQFKNCVVTDLLGRVVSEMGQRFVPQSATDVYVVYWPAGEVWRRLVLVIG